MWVVVAGAACYTTPAGAGVECTEAGEECGGWGQCCQGWCGELSGVCEECQVTSQSSITELSYHITCGQEDGGWCRLDTDCCPLSSCSYPAGVTTGSGFCTPL